MDVINLPEGTNIGSADETSCRFYEYYKFSETIIKKGGEEINNNTYGFEIEFCTHDSVILSFTHVEVAKIEVMSNGFLYYWKIETDSGNVLELVSDPLVFNNISDAQIVKKNIGESLASSVYGNPINGILFGEWLEIMLPKVMQYVYQDSKAVVNYVITSKDDVSKYLTVENVDDNINIPAALIRFDKINNNEKWKEYIKDIIISRSEKDWMKGYGSQLNMPMTLLGYYIYSWKKYDHSKSRMAELINGNIKKFKIDDEENISSKIETWFWRTLIYEVSSYFIEQITIYVFLKNDIKQWNKMEAKEASFIYVSISKILTGALAYFSEKSQLELQKYAWEHSSTAVISQTFPKIDNLCWREFHSSLKSLTGLWFKAPLIEILKRELMETEFLKSFAFCLKSNNFQDFWLKKISDLEKILDDLDEKFSFTDLDPMSSDLEIVIEKKEQLCFKIKEIMVSLSDALGDVNGITKGKYDLNIDNNGNYDEKFLDYSEKIPWEGRKDTMIKPIIILGEDTRYLIEHRFN
jgi:hypothetical protein